jgi:hypothetical protein
MFYYNKLGFALPVLAQNSQRPTGKDIQTDLENAASFIDFVECSGSSFKFKKLISNF